MLYDLFSSFHLKPRYVCDAWYMSTVYFGYCSKLNDDCCVGTTVCSHEALTAFLYLALIVKSDVLLTHLTCSIY